MKKYILFVAVFLISLFSFNLVYASGNFKIVGYYRARNSSVIQNSWFSYLTDINFSFLGVNSDGSLDFTRVDPTQLAGLVSQAHASGVKVLIAVFSNDSLVTPAANSSVRTVFVNNIYNFVISNNLDGVDIDWEFPDYSPQNFTSLMSDLSTKFHSNGKLVTAAVHSYHPAGITNSVFTSVDWLNIMSYSEGTPNSTYAGAVTDINVWINKGLPAAKAVLGVPFYGANPRGDEMDYKQIVSLDANAPYYDQGGSENVNGYYYNSIPTIKSKTTLALSKNAGGIMIWELSEDTTDNTSLLRAIAETSNTTPPTRKGK